MVKKDDQKLSKTIWLTEATYERLLKHAEYGDSKDRIVSRVLDVAEKLEVKHVR